MKKSLLGILEQPIDKLARVKGPIPNKETLKLYREVLKFCDSMDWTNEKGQKWQFKMCILHQQLQETFQQLHIEINLRYIKDIKFLIIVHRGDILAQSARKEIELAKDEKDPLLCMQMILTSREAIQKTKEKMNEEMFRNQTKINQTREDYDGRELDYRFKMNK